ncbi:MAG TPA: PPK2 family polyphosphate kinase [Candidatus Dormibacteraeota bacterium]|jgi:PPK2 family polyphosphate:nucleotide phosphotransferase|nr:PPK2 family polyphosphate kinase [Candidatus Dormibacteraeota bacterium]
MDDHHGRVGVGDKERALLHRLAAPLRVAPGKRVELPGDFDPGHTAGFVSQDAAAGDLAATTRLLGELQSRLAAQSVHAMVAIVQGLDASGKDGAIAKVMSGINPSGVRVHSFKVPSLEELRHDYLWRYTCALPERGSIAMFNRSHYEEVLVVRVHPELLERQKLPSDGQDPHIWTRRYREINEWERHLVDSGIHVVKLFLNVSRAEQRRRFLERIDNPEKNWKFSPDDIAERHHWDAYQRAYSDVLSETSTAWAPWHVVPADHKWFARLSVAAVLVEELIRIDPRYPAVPDAVRAELAAARAELVAEDSRV